MTKIAILCGESPLPVCQALKTLAADEVVIIHGQGGSKNVADRVKDFCKDTLNIDKSKVHLLEVDAFVTSTELIPTGLCAIILYSSFL